MLLYLANTNRWFHNRLWDPHDDEDDLVWVDDVHDAELVIFPFPPWRDPAAPFNFRRLPVSMLSRVYTFSADDSPLLWAPGVYTSLHRSGADAAFRGGFYIRPHEEGPQGMGKRLEPRESRSDRYLWSFLGTVENYPQLRTKFFDLSDDRGQCIDSTPWWRGRTVPGTHTSGPISRRRFHETFDDYADSIQNSKFVLCPRGKGASSIRLFEAMQAGRCPVIMSDEWLPPDDVDWSRCSIRVPESDVHQIPRLLARALR